MCGTNFGGAEEEGHSPRIARQEGFRWPVEAARATVCGRSPLSSKAATAAAASATGSRLEEDLVGHMNRRRRRMDQWTARSQKGHSWGGDGTGAMATGDAEQKRAKPSLSKLGSQGTVGRRQGHRRAEEAR